MLSIENSRKHGPFDSRYPPIRHKQAPESLSRPGGEPCDWQAFRSSFYPGCRRHDFDALAAYEASWNGVEGRAVTGRLRTNVSDDDAVVPDTIAHARLNAFAIRGRDPAA